MSRFVSSGTDQQPTERDDAWLQAQKAVEARQLEKLEAGRQDGKSLYETLQANKAAKQEAFEESTRLRNQFRSLDDDEVDFLDSVAEAARAKEAEARRDAEVQLESFRALQQEAEKSSTQSTDILEPVTSEAWTTAGRKRKKQDVLAGVVKKRHMATKEPSASSSEAQTTKKEDLTIGHYSEEKAAVKTSATTSIPVLPSPPAVATGRKPLLGLTDYSSDED